MQFMHNNMKLSENSIELKELLILIIVITLQLYTTRHNHSIKLQPR